MHMCNYEYGNSVIIVGDCNIARLALSTILCQYVTGYLVLQQHTDSIHGNEENSNPNQKCIVDTEKPLAS